MFPPGQASGLGLSRASIMPSRSKADLEESDEDPKQFDWDGNALNRHPWVKHLAKRAYNHDPRFRQH
eukprot:1352002-Prymnesium_polylepis.1